MILGDKIVGIPDELSDWWFRQGNVFLLDCPLDKDVDISVCIVVDPWPPKWGEVGCVRRMVWWQCGTLICRDCDSKLRSQGTELSLRLDSIGLGGSLAREVNLSPHVKKIFLLAMQGRSDLLFIKDYSLNIVKYYFLMNSTSIAFWYVLWIRTGVHYWS